MSDEHGLPLPVEGDTEEEMRNRVVAGTLLRAAGVRGCDCTDPCDCLQVEALWVHHERGITIQASSGLVRLGVVFRDGERTDGGDEPKEDDVADENEKAELPKRAPGIAVYNALTELGRNTLGKNPEILHEAIMPLVRGFDDGLEVIWGLVNDGAPKREVLDAIETCLPEFRRDNLPRRKD